MSTEINVDATLDKREKYAELLPQIQGLIDGESDSIALLANVSAALKTAFGFLWVGFYRVQGSELVLGPFQGPVACVRIPKGKGVCGTAWAEDRTVVVDDVDSFPGHIACSPDSRSEIVVPIHAGGAVAYVLDIDSSELGDFGDVDRQSLRELASMIEEELKLASSDGR